MLDDSGADVWAIPEADKNHFVAFRTFHRTKGFGTASEDTGVNVFADGIIYVKFDGISRPVP